MSDLKIQGEVQLSAEGAEAALNRVGEKAEQMATRLQSSGEKAGQAVDAIGKSADDNAEQFTRAEGRISDSIKRATKNLELMGKTASQKLEIRIADQGLDASKFEPMLLKLREIEAAQIKAGTASRGMGGQLQNTSYQLQDFIVQVNGGTDATKALGQQLPQMLVGFGAAGAAIGVIAALLPNMVAAFSDSATGAKKFSDAMGDFDKAVGEVGATTKSFDMEKLYEQFNASSAAVRAATIEQVNFQREYIRTTQLVAEKKFGESLSGVGAYSTIDKLAGSWGSSGADKLAKDLGVSIKAAQDMLPVLTGLKNGSEDVSLAFNKFGTTLLGGNAKAIELATSMATLSKSERDAAAASSSLSEAQAKMAKGHVTTKKEMDEAAKATKSAASEADAFAAVMDKLTGKNVGLDASYWRDLDTLHNGYIKGRLTTEQYAEAVGKLTNEQKFAKDIEKQHADLIENMLGTDLKRVTALQKSNESLADEIQMLGMSKDQQALYRAAKIDSAAADELATAAAIENNLEEMRINGAMPEIIAGYEALAAAKRAAAEQLSAQADLERHKSAKEVAVKAAEDSANAWKQFGQDINRSLTDSLFRAFESGESFGKAFVKSLKNTLKTSALKLAISYTIDSAGGIVSAGLNALAGTSGANNGAGVNYLGLANNASTLNSIYGVGAQYLTGSAIGASSASLLYANGVGIAGGDSLGALIAANGNWAGVSTGASATGAASGTASGGSGAAAGVSSVAWIAAIVAGMYMSSEAWRKGIRWENYAKQDSVKQWDAEVAIRAMKDEPMRAIFGDKFVNSQLYAILGGGSLSAQIHYAIQSALFGSKRVIGYQTTGTFSEDQQGFTGQYGVNMKKTGGLFSKSRTWTDWYALPDQADSVMDTIYKSVRNSFMMLGETFDDTSLADKMKGFSYAFTVASTDMATVANAAANGLSEAIGNILTPSISSLEKSGETWTAAFQRILLETNAVARTLDLMGKTVSGTFGKNNLDGVLRASDAFIALFGSIDAYNTAFSGYYANFYTAADQSQQLWDDMAKAFGGIGQAMPTTRQGFKDLVNSLDLSSAAGQSTFAALMSLQAGFAALTPSIDDVTAAAAALVTANREAQAQQITKYVEAQRTAQEDIVRNAITATEATATAAQGVADTFTSLLSSLGDYKRSLLLGDTSTLSPAAKYSEAKRLYEDTVSKARLGDTSAALKLQTAADDFLKASMAAGTSGSYALDFGNVMANVTSVMGVAERQIPIAESQLQVAQDQLAALNSILDKMTGAQTPLVVGNYQQAATDWASFFSTTAIGDVVQSAAGAMQRISESMGLFIDKAGKGYTFSAADSPYALANSSDAYRQYMLAQYGQYSIPGFAAGGLHRGGLRLVGERGKEMEITGPSNIVNSGDTRSMLDNWSSMAVELKALRAEMALLRDDQRAGNAAIANNTGRTVRLFEKFDAEGMPEVRAA